MSTIIATDKTQRWHESLYIIKDVGRQRPAFYKPPRARNARSQSIVWGQHAYDHCYR